MAFEKGSAPWNKGLTKNTDNRMMTISGKVSATLISRILATLLWRRAKNKARRIRVLSLRIGE